MAKTEHYKANKTSRMPGRNNGTHGILIEEEVVWTDESTGDEYKITPIFVNEGGETQIFEALRLSDNVKCVAKIDTMRVLNDPLAKDNREKTINFLRKHIDYKKYHILPLFASGEISVSMQNGESEMRAIDIFPFCNEGDMRKKKILFDVLKDKVIPSLIDAIDEIHKNGVAHRDITPANIYYYDNEYVVGDFGTAVFIGDQEYWITKSVRGTTGYRAPEITLTADGTGTVPFEADFFALGFTLATFLLGTHLCENMLQSEHAFFDYVQKKSENGIQLDLPEEQVPFQWLFTALTRYNRADRCDAEGVRLWLKDVNAFHQKYIVGYQHSKKTGWLRAFNFDNKEYYNERDLANAMAGNWELAKEFLYREFLYEHFMSINQTLALNLRKDITENKDISRDLGVAQAIHYIMGGGNICWKGLPQFETIGSIASHIYNTGTGTPNSTILELLQSGYLSWKYQQISDNATAQSIQEIEALSQKYPHMAYYYAFYAWLDENDKKLKTPDACFTDWFKGQNADQLSDSQLGQLAAVTSQPKMIREFRDNTDNHSVDQRIKSLYELFFKLCENKKAVVDHYLSFSADAWLPWFQSNLPLYSFNTQQARELHKEFQAIPIRNDMTMLEVQANCDKIHRKFKQFQTLFQGDFYKMCQGEEGAITATDIDAFFMERFFGKDVPNGFMKSRSSFVNNVDNHKDERKREVFQKIYDEALSHMHHGNSMNMHGDSQHYRNLYDVFKKAEYMLNKIPFFKDAQALEESCHTRANKYLQMEKDYEEWARREIEKKVRRKMFWFKMSIVAAVVLTVMLTVIIVINFGAIASVITGIGNVLGAIVAIALAIVLVWLFILGLSEDEIWISVLAGVVAVPLIVISIINFGGVISFFFKVGFVITAIVAILLAIAIPTVLGFLLKAIWNWAKHGRFTPF